MLLHAALTCLACPCSADKIHQECVKSATGPNDPMSPGKHGVPAGKKLVIPGNANIDPDGNVTLVFFGEVQIKKAETVASKAGLSLEPCYPQQSESQLYHTAWKNDFWALKKLTDGDVLLLKYGDNEMKNKGNVAILTLESGLPEAANVGTNVVQYKSATDHSATLGVGTLLRPAAQGAKDIVVEVDVLSGSVSSNITFIDAAGNDVRVGTMGGITVVELDARVAGAAPAHLCCPIE